MQISICEEKFRRIDRELQLTQDRMVRIEEKMDKVLFRLTAMMCSMALFLVPTLVGFYQIQTSASEKAYSIIRDYKSIENQNTIDDYLQKKNNSGLD